MKKSRKPAGARKWFLGAALVFILAAAGVILYVLTHLDAVVKAGIEKYGSQATGTPVRVESVKISLRKGEGAVRGLTITNPAGFEGVYAFSLGETGIKIDLPSLAREVKIIDAIHVTKPGIYFEINSAGFVNLEELKKNLEKGFRPVPAKKSETENKGKTSGPEPRIIIRRVLFSDCVVHVRIAPGGIRQYDLRLPAVEMTNLGGKTGATPDQVTRQVIGELSRRAIREVEKMAVGAAVDRAKELIQNGNWSKIFK